jgi:hypothetical protein
MVAAYQGFIQVLVVPVFGNSLRTVSTRDLLDLTGSCDDCFRA